MSKRDEHTFQFKAKQIAEAAEKQAIFHEKRLNFWKKEYDRAVVIVEKTIGAKLIRREVSNGYRVDVEVDYGDPSAYRRMNEAFDKMESHREFAEQFRSDQQVYATQGDRTYELALDDVQFYHLDGRAEED
jgi:hypothetical protein